MKCVSCGINELSGKQSKFCSRECMQKDINSRLQNYKAQQERGLKRKIECIKVKGGKCSKCGYNKNIAALDFHHIDPSNKLDQLDSRSLSNHSQKWITKELEKCILLCANCHREEHNPDLVL